MPTTKAQQKAVAKYTRANYDRLYILVKKGGKTALQQAAAKYGDSLNEYVKRAVKEQYRADTGEDIEL